MKYSIVIPVYNVEKYIDKCLTSVSNQTYTNFEVIIVNDGTKDNSEKIIKRYCNSDKRFKYFKKENGGLSDARNYGVDKVNGDYILFLDSDDYLENQLLEKLNNSSKSDLVKFCSQSVDENGNFIHRYRSTPFNSISALEALSIIVSDEFIEPAWIYSYNTKFFKENNFRYALNKYHEDFGLTPYILLMANSITSIDYVGINYVQREGSIMSDNNTIKSKQKANDFFEQYLKLIKIINSCDVLKSKKEIILIYLVDSVARKYKILSGKNKKEYKKMVKKYKVYNDLPSNNYKRFVKKICFKIDINLYLFITKLSRKK